MFLKWYDENQAQIVKYSVAFLKPEHFWTKCLGQINQVYSILFL